MRAVPELARDVGRRDGSDVRQYVEHLLIRQLAANAVHRAEQDAIRDRDEQLPIGFGPSDLRPKISRLNDQILVVRSVSIQFGPMATETLLLIHTLSSLRITRIT